MLTTGGDQPSCLGFVDGPTLSIVADGPIGSSQAAYCGFDPSALEANQEPSVVFQIELQDGLYSTIKSQFGSPAGTGSRLSAA